MKRCDRGAIAIATSDISIAADIRHHGEFASDTFEIAINYKLNLLSSIQVYTSTSRGSLMREQTRPSYTEHTISTKLVVLLA